MAPTSPLKASPSMKEWMARSDHPKEASMVEKVNCRSLLLSLNKVTLL